MIISGRQYELVKKYTKEHKLQDLYLCKDTKTGIKECFTGYDIANNSGSFYSPKKDYHWTIEEDELIRQNLRAGMTPHGISKKLSQLKHTSASIKVRASQLRQKMIEEGTYDKS